MAKVMFLQRIWYPLGAVMSLSAALKKAGHDATVSVGEEDKLLKEVGEYCPDIIAIPTITSFRQFMIAIAKMLRRQGYRGIIIAGGYDASFFPNCIDLAPIDAVCIGEGDEAIVELANAVDNGEDWSRIKNLWVKKNGRITKNPLRPFLHMNEKPFNDRDIYRNYDPYFSKYMVSEQVMVGRGCPYRCSYCYNHAYRRMYEGVDRRYCTLREPRVVIDEILSIRENYPQVKSIRFTDGSLGYNKEWLLEFCRLYKEKGIELPFSLSMCMNEADEEICKALASTGKCFLIQIGLESGNETFRTVVLNKPLCTDSACVNAARLMRKYGLRFILQVMLGSPGEKLEWAYQTLEMAVEISGRDTLHTVSIFKPFPKLNLTTYGVRTGAYDKDIINDSELTEGTVTNLFSNFRRDEEGRRIGNLARFSHIYMRFPFTKGIIKRWLVKMPDNRVFRAIQRYTTYHYTFRHHIRAPWKYLIMYTLLHGRKASSIN